MRGVRAARHSCSRPKQMEYALTGAWLDNLPPSRPDGVWQLHATWLKPGEELEVEPEFDAVLALLGGHADAESSKIPRHALINRV